MGILDGLGVGSIGAKIGPFLKGLGLVVGTFIMFLMVAGIIIFFLTKAAKKKKFNQKIIWFEQIGENTIPIGQDLACELTIPGTNIQVFYIDKKKMYLPRFTKKMGKNEYWICIRDNREFVNFKMTNLNKQMKEVGLDFDHTDMRYAMTNLKELIKRNYKDNAQPWWKEYKDIIAVIALVLVLSLCFYFLISKTGALVDKAGVLIEHADGVIKALGAARGSGVVPAA